MNTRTYKTKHGYIMQLCPNHHRADKRGMVMQHILVWEEFNGRIVPDGYCVHHVNGIKDDNRPENLLLMEFGEHTKSHHIGSKRKLETRKLLSDKAKKRLSDSRNHPLYKEINVSEMLSRRNKGLSVEVLCREYGICKYTFYKKVKEFGNVQ